MPKASITTLPQGSVLQWDTSVSAWQATTVGAGFTASSIMAGGTKGQALTTNGLGTNTAWQGMTTQGDVEYYDGTKRARLAPGTSGQFLQTQGASANPVWATTTDNPVQIFNNHVTTSYDNTTGTDFLSGTVTGNNMGVNGTIIIEAWGTCSTNANNNDSIRIQLNDSTIVTFGFGEITITSPTLWKIWATVANRNSASSQIVSLMTYLGSGTVGGILMDGGGTAAVDTTSNFTVELNIVAASGHQIAVDHCTMYVYKSA